MIISRHFTGWMLSLTLGTATVFAAGARKQPGRPATAADNATAYKGAIVTDASTGNVLFEDRADVMNPPASMTKLMTFAVVHDRLAAGTLTLATPVKIETSDAKMGGTQVFLDPRETFSVEDLIFAMMIQSANDASHALARATAGSVPAFVELMNAKAEALGMKNTTFRTPHGLPPSTRKAADGDLTSPRDFSLLARHLVQHTDVLKYTSVRLRTFGAGVRAQPMEMKNHNNLLGKVGGVDGLKTGFTDAAGYCLSATAQRNGRRVIVVIMGSLGPGGQRDLGRARDIKAIELLERGFAALPPAPVAAAVPADSPLRPAPTTPAPKPAAANAATPPASSAEPMIKFSMPKK
ncbi:MAG: D-alanyl-D-alanine carboxypeptidase family protein [Opitutaceae bacterium]|nr:D-alanyl-D-alanine carboxypeptidase family protein [Opitutaceae bacterium]